MPRTLTRREGWGVGGAPPHVWFCVERESPPCGSSFPSSAAHLRRTGVFRAHGCVFFCACAGLRAAVRARGGRRPRHALAAPRLPFFCLHSEVRPRGVPNAPPTRAPRRRSWLRPPPPTWGPRSRTAAPRTPLAAFSSFKTTRTRACLARRFSTLRGCAGRRGPPLGTSCPQSRTLLAWTWAGRWSSSTRPT